MRTLSDIAEEYEFLEGDERYRLLIELGRDLEPMPDALKTDATLVRGCSAQVWVYPTSDNDRLHFLADSNAAITKGIVALIISAVQDQHARDVAKMDIAARARTVRSQKPAFEQSHAGRAEHDRAGEGACRADRGGIG